MDSATTSLPFRSVIFVPAITAPEESVMRPRMWGGAFCALSVAAMINRVVVKASSRNMQASSCRHPTLSTYLFTNHE